MGVPHSPRLAGRLSDWAKDLGISRSTLRRHLRREDCPLRWSWALSHKDRWIDLDVIREYLDWLSEGGAR